MRSMLCGGVLAAMLGLATQSMARADAVAPFATPAVPDLAGAAGVGPLDVYLIDTPDEAVVDVAKLPASLADLEGRKGAIVVPAGAPGEIVGAFVAASSALVIAHLRMGGAASGPSGCALRTDALRVCLLAREAGIVDLRITTTAVAGVPPGDPFELVSPAVAKGNGGGLRRIVIAPQRIGPKGVMASAFFWSGLLESGRALVGHFRAAGLDHVVIVVR